MNEAELIFNNILERRTVKPDRYTGNKIDDAKILRMLEAAHWAPTHGHTEPWQFKVFTEEGKQRLFNFLVDWMKEEGANEIKINKTRYRIDQASHIISIGMKRGDNPKIPEVEELLAVAAAVQNMLLMAQALGLAAYWSTGERAFKKRMRDFLGLDEKDRSLGFLFVGEPAVRDLRGHRLSTYEDHFEWVRNN